MLGLELHCTGRDNRFAVQIVGLMKRVTDLRNCMYGVDLFRKGKDVGTIYFSSVLHVLGL